MTARTVRRLVIALCVLGVAGLILTSILDSTGAAVTIGLCTAVAVLCLIVATAVSREAPSGHATAAGDDFDEEQAARVEHRVQDLVAGGGDEAALRSLVRDAVRLGRGTGPQGGGTPADEEAWRA